MTTSVTDRVSQHNIRPARPRPRPRQQRTRPRPRPIVWTQTGLVLRPTVSDHITAQYEKQHQFSVLNNYHLLRGAQGGLRLLFWTISWKISDKPQALDKNSDRGSLQENSENWAIKRASWRSFEHCGFVEFWACLACLANFWTTWPISCQASRPQCAAPWAFWSYRRYGVYMPRIVIRRTL